MKKNIIDTILKFRNERNWEQFHIPKDLAISISLEAAELLEIFQWSGKDLVCKNKKDKIKEELADILIYCILMANYFHLDIDKIIKDKIELNKKKYPKKLSYGSNKKYTELIKNKNKVSKY